MVSSKVAGWSWGYLMSKRFINIDDDTRIGVKPILLKL